MESKIVGLRIVYAIFILLPLVFLWLGAPIVLTAIRTGKLLARGAIYDRSAQPVMYWLGMGCWFLLFIFLSFVSVGLLTRYYGDSALN